ncbi:MAG: hypothetical protein IPK22_28805 [Verrucomicrobiaceae bacterium]|nr:hypothetical protein [Verrucomicrobiaceae bacterium]
MPRENIDQVIEELDARVLEKENAMRAGPAGRLDYVKEQLREIANTPDPQQAAQKAFNLMQDVDNAIVGEAAAKALLMREDGQALCVEVGKNLLLAELQKPGMRTDAFVRESVAINGFGMEVIREGSPEMIQRIEAGAQEIHARAQAANVADMNAEQKLQHEAALASDMIDLATAPLQGPAAEQYLRAMAEVINGNDPVYNQRMNALAGKGASPQQVQLNKAKLAEGFLNNISALRVVGPELNKLRVNEHWGNANQIMLKVISGYRNENLNNLSARFQALAPRAFTPENRQKVRAMFGRMNDAQQAPALGLNLIQGAQQDSPQRAARLADAIQARPEAVYNPAAQQQPAVNAGDQQQPAVNAGDQQQPAVNAGDQQQRRSRFASVRDALSAGVNRVRNTVGESLENKGNEQKLGDVAADKVELYKSMQEALKEMERLDREASIGAAMSSRQGTNDFHNPQIPSSIENLKAEMASMERNDPGLKQLDRSKVGQIVHSKIRGAAKAVGSKLKA